MFNKFYRKGVSLLEALIAMFLLGMITMIYFNSTTTFIDSQQTLIKFDRKEQVAELILQGVMEYTKQNETLYGTIESDGEQTMNGTTDTINVTIDQPGILPANMVLPKVGDIFVISGIKNFNISINKNSHQIMKSYFHQKKNKYKIKFIEEKIPLGTAGCIKYLKKNKKDFFVTNCDVIFDIDYRFHLSLIYILII